MQRPLLSMAGKNGIVVSASETNVWTRWVAGVIQSIPSVLQGKHRQTVSAKAGRCSLGSSSPSGRENKHYRKSDAEVEELREYLKRYKNAEKRQEMQCELAGGEGWFEEDVKMEEDEEVDSKKKMDQRKKELQKQLRDIEEVHRCAAKCGGRPHREVAAGAARY